MLRRVYSTLDRVLVAHLTTDPFVEEIEGTTELLRWLGRANIPVMGVATFAPVVTRAITRRFGWDEETTVVDTTGHIDGAPLWSAVAREASVRGIAPDDVAFVSDDPWELGYAAGAGCGLPIHIGEADPDELDALGIRSASSLLEASYLLGRPVPETRLQPSMCSRGGEAMSRPF